MMILSTGLWKSPLPKLCKHRNGRDDRRKKVHPLFREKVQSKVTSLSMHISFKLIYLIYFHAWLIN